MSLQSPSILGLHHITAIAGSPGRNVLFYTGLLGLRLVKITVNFDDPGSYHLYYGSGTGAPGSILTFFPWVHGAPGRRGAGETSLIALSIPSGSTAFWCDRLAASGVAFTEPTATDGIRAIQFFDPDGMAVQLVEAGGLDPALGWPEGPVPLPVAIHGLHHVVLDIHEPGRTADLLEETLGFTRRNSRDPLLQRFETGPSGPSRLVEIAESAQAARGRMGPGIIHHIAWRAEDDAAQAEWRSRLLAAKLNVTTVQDRQYFHSIYFREPGGVLFEIATDNPGFLVDEPYETLGTELKLPPWLEPHREALIKALPALPKD